MADQKQIEDLYNWVDGFHDLMLGRFGDFTCAFFHGDYSKTLEQAQLDKHEYVLQGIGFKPRQRLLDIGSGWGPMLKAAEDKGGNAVGLTLSSAQQRYCSEHGLDARLQDYKTATPGDLGVFDAIVSIGAIEHFCSIEEFRTGKQEEVYRNFFKFCYDLLPVGGRLYLHTMTWGKKVPDPDEFSLEAPTHSENAILARAAQFYPGSWLPTNEDQLVNAARPYFKLVTSNDGRLDYVETVDRWDKSIIRLFLTWRFFPAFFTALKLLPRFATSRNFRAQIGFVVHRDQIEIFKREIFGHRRMFFEKV